MAEIGAIASAVGVVGFAGQVVQGCSYLKSLIDDIKDAPVELQYLQAELAIIESVVKDTSTQNGNITSAGVLNPALASCLEAIAAIARGRWHQVKTAFAKQDTKKRLERLSRAKDTLIAAQMRISLNQTEKIEELGESALTKMDELGISIDKIDATAKQNLASTASIQERLATLQADSATSSGLLHLVAISSREFEPGIRRIENGVSAIGAQLTDQTQTGISDLRADISSVVKFLICAENPNADISDGITRVDNQVAAGPQQLEAMFRRVLNTEMSEILRNNFDRSQTGGTTLAQTEQPNTRLNEQILEMPIQKHPRNIKSKPRYRWLSSSAYQYYLFRIFVENYGLLEGSESSKIIDPSEELHVEPMDETLYTKIRVFVKLGFYNRMFEYKRAWNACQGTFDRNLRIYNVVAWDSPIFEAVENADIKTVEVLLRNRLASPFDISPSGDSLLWFALRTYSLSEHYKPMNLTLGKLKKMFSIVGLLLKWYTKTHPSHHFFLFICRIIQNLRPFKEFGIEDIGGVLRHLADSYAEDLYIFEDLSNANVMDFGCYITLDLIHTPLGRMLITKDRWESNWIASGCDKNLWESDFQISNEPEGKILRKMLMMGCENGSLHYRPQCSSRERHRILHNWTNAPNELNAAGDFTGTSPELAPMHSLLTMISDYPNNTELVRGCLNRLVLLLKNGWDAHLGAPLSPPFSFFKQFTRFLVPLSRFALWTNTDSIWKEALRQGGYSDFEIMDIFDSDIYLGVPDLFQGVAYVTQEECLAGLINHLLTEENSSIDTDLAERETRLRCWNIKDLIRKSKEVFSRRKLPGAWPEDEKTTQRIEPGENVEFDDMMREYGIPWKVGDDKGAEAEYLAQRRKDTALKRRGKREAGVTEMNEDEQEFAFPQSNDETDAGADFERTAEWLAESWKVL